MIDPYKLGAEFAELFGRFEHALKRSNFIRDKPVAEADWTKYASELGTDFFEHVNRLKLADTLIGDPPRKLMTDDLKWVPEHPAPLVNVVELFEKGVCRVRNSLIHGEKFVGQADHLERDATLISEALAILLEAQNRIPTVAALLAKN